MKKIKYVLDIFLVSTKYQLIRTTLIIIFGLVFMTALGLILESKPLEKYKIRGNETGSCNIRSLISCYPYWYPYVLIIYYLVSMYFDIIKMRNDVTYIPKFEPAPPCKWINILQFILMMMMLPIFLISFPVVTSYLGLLTTKLYNFTLPYDCDNHLNEVGRYICNVLPKELRISECKSEVNIFHVWDSFYNNKIPEIADIILHQLTCTVNGCIFPLLVILIMAIFYAYKRCRIEFKHLTNDVRLSSIKIGD